MLVEDKTVVALRYLMSDKLGQPIENTFNGPAVEYLHGSGTILPQLEEELKGLGCGDRKTFSFTDEYAQYIHFDIIVDSVRAASPDEIAAGKPVSIVDERSAACGPGCSCSPE